MSVKGIGYLNIWCVGKVIYLRDKINICAYSMEMYDLVGGATDAMQLAAVSPIAIVIFYVAICYIELAYALNMGNGV